MARFFDRSENHYAENNDSAPATGAPFTMACWVRASVTLSNLDYCILQLQDKDVSDQYWRLNVNPSESAPINFGGVIEDGTTLHFFEGSVTPLIDTWYHVAFVERATNDHSVFVDGGSEVNSPITRAPTGVDSFAIGRERNAGSGDGWEGDITDIAVWDTDLSDDELGELANGSDPRGVASANLVFYSPFMGRDSPEMEIVGGRNLTLNGTAYADQPPIRKIRRKFRGKTIAPVSPKSIVLRPVQRPAFPLSAM